MGRKTPKEKLRTMFELLERGWSVAAVAEQLEMGKTTVRDNMKAYNFVMPKAEKPIIGKKVKVSKKVRLSEEEVDEFDRVSDALFDLPLASQLAAIYYNKRWFEEEIAEICYLNPENADDILGSINTKAIAFLKEIGDNSLEVDDNDNILELINTNHKK